MPWPVLPPGVLTAIPSTRISSFYSPPPPGLTWTSPQTSGNVLAYSGGCRTTLLDGRVYLVVHGGGHGNYPGNEVYGVRLDASYPLVERWTDATAWWVAPNPTTQEAYPDGSPAAVHTYGALCGIPGGFIRFGGALTFAGWPSRSVWRFLKDSGWTRGPDFPDAHASGQSITGMACWHSAAQQVAIRHKNRVGLIDPDTLVFSQRATASGGSAWEGTALFDHVRGRMVVMAKATNPLPPEVWNAPAVGAWTLIGAPAMTGDVPVGKVSLAYDPVADRYLGWIATDPTALYVCEEPELLVWTRTVMAGVMPTPNGSGTFGRMQYIPDGDFLVWLHNTGLDVVGYQLPRTPPDTTPPAEVPEGGTIAWTGTYGPLVVSFPASPSDPGDVHHYDVERDEGGVWVDRQTAPATGAPWYSVDFGIHPPSAARVRPVDAAVPVGNPGAWTLIPWNA